MREHPVRAVLRRLLAALIGLYFRRITVVGPAPERRTAGRLLAANHVNALVDPILVLTQTRAVISPVAKSTLWKLPGLRWLLDVAAAVPIVRRVDAPDKAAGTNDRVFARVGAHLAGGGNILIFPEGTSHNQPHLAPLRTGAGRMLARARADGGRGLAVQAVALAFDARDTFRSRALVLFAPPRALDELVPPDADADAVAAAVTEAVRADLASLLVEAPSWALHLGIARVAELYAHSHVAEGDDAARSLPGQHALGLRVGAAQRVLAAAAPAEVEALLAEVARYDDALAAVGLDDEVVALGVVSRRAGAWLRALAMVVTAPLALVGLALYYLPYVLPRAITRRLGPTTDAVSTYKLGVALVVYPLWFTVGVVLALLLVPWPWSALAVAALVVTPWAVLPWLDRQARLGVVWRALRPGAARAALPRLVAHRAALMARLEEVRRRVEGEADPRT
ncbi:MAG: 1-acyl-sn-glycerol-3-phosphate acyltransferase [Kofleriaceae bacterium]